MPSWPLEGFQSNFPLRIPDLAKFLGVVPKALPKETYKHFERQMEQDFVCCFIML